MTPTPERAFTLAIAAVTVALLFRICNTSFRKEKGGRKEINKKTILMSVDFSDVYDAPVPKF